MRICVGSKRDRTNSFWSLYFSPGFFYPSPINLKNYPEDQKFRILLHVHTLQNIIWSTVQYILNKLECWLKWCSFWWQAFIDVEKDLTERETPMDRLICGDVGFGKTEVAMRGIFIVVSAGFQAMVLAPTIILAKQHYDVMTERFANYSEIKVAIFSGAQVCRGRS